MLLSILSMLLLPKTKTGGTNYIFYGVVTVAVVLGLYVALGAYVDSKQQEVRDEIKADANEKILQVIQDQVDSIIESTERMEQVTSVRNEKYDNIADAIQNIETDGQTGQLNRAEVRSLICSANLAAPGLCDEVK